MRDFLITNNTVPVLFSILGWFVVHYLSAKRDKKKHRYDEATVLYTDLSNIYSMAATCHIAMDSVGVSPTDLQSLTTNCNLFKVRLFSFLESLDNPAARKIAFQPLIIAFRQSVTSDFYKTFSEFRKALNLSYSNLEKEITAIRKKLS